MRGLLMIEPLYHQTVAGRKTQTRRSGGLEEVNKDPDDWEIFAEFGHRRTFIGLMFNNKVVSTLLKKTFKPRYRAGEVMYLKEPMRFIFLGGGKPIYKYDETLVLRDLHDWKNKLFMPASAARAFVRITGIRCERLLDISDADCLAEGIETVTANANAYKLYTAKPKEGILQEFTISPQASYFSLFRFANKIGPKKEIGNPWVWVYDYEYLPDYKIA